MNCYEVLVSFTIPNKVATPPNVLHVCADGAPQAITKATKWLQGVGVADIAVDSVIYKWPVQVPP